MAQSLYKSDHHPVLFTVTDEGAQATGAGSQGAAPTAASKPFSPRRQVRGVIIQIAKTIKADYIRSRRVVEDDWATHWLDVTGMELDESEPERRRDRKWEGWHKGVKLPELPKGAATDDLFQELEEAMDKTAAQPAATAAAATPGTNTRGYRTDESEKLPHIAEMACPVSTLTMGKLTEQVRALWDSGA